MAQQGLWQAQAPPGDRTFYKRQMLTIQKGYANTSEGELLPVVAEVMPHWAGADAPAAQAVGSAESPLCAPRLPQWLENNRKASTERPPAWTSAPCAGLDNNKCALRSSHLLYTHNGTLWDGLLVLLNSACPRNTGQRRRCPIGSEARGRAECVGGAGAEVDGLLHGERAAEPC